MNVAYKHLDSKLRIAELTVGQWIGVLLGLAIGIAWGVYVSPLGSTLTLTTSVYLAALPIGAAMLGNVTELDPWLVARSALRWRRLEGRFVAGAGRSASGYVVRDDQPMRGGAAGSPRLRELDPALLWEESR